MASPSTGMMVPVQNVMTGRVVLVFQEIPMAEVRTIVTRYDYNAFPVVTSEGRLVGMVTKGDLLRVFREGLGNPDVWLQPVSRWMAHGVLALRPKDSVETAITLLVDSGFRSLPVIDDDGKVVGIVSRNDLMQAIGGSGRA